MNMSEDICGTPES